MQVENEPKMSPEELEQQEQVEEKEPSKKVDVKKEIISWITNLGVAVLAALLIRTFIFEPIRVDGSSMADTLQDGEVMIVTKPEYLFGDPEFGDIVICKYPGRKENFVKRIMGVPGDEIAIIANTVFRNGEAIEEPYLTPDRNNNGFTMMPIKLAEGEYFVMGDNRDNSNDSRTMGRGKPVPLSRDMIIGHVRWVAFPFGSIRGVE